jgi:hypothetical protein
LVLDPTKTLDINAIEAALDGLLEHYRQALRAVELLPVWGRVPNNDYIVQITQPVGPTRSRIRRLRISLQQARIRHADWVRSHFATRSFARMFLRSHIRSKLRTIADHLEVERFASGHMDKNTSKRLDDVITKLRDYDKSLAQRRTFWLRLPGWIWPAAAPVLFTYLTTLAIPSITIIGVRVLIYIAIYLLYVVLFAWLPLFGFVALGGFRWKRLILLGQAGDMKPEIATNLVLRWASAPQANAYEAENRFFGTLGLPKPDEFPWDLVLEPPPFLSTALVLSFFTLVLALCISAKEPSLPIVIAILIFVALFILYVRFILRPIFGAVRERRQRGAC